MMANKVTFQKLTEDIEKLNKEEEVEKSEGLQGAEFIEPAKEEPEKEPEKKEEDEPEVKPEEEPEPEKKEEPEAEPEAKKEDEEEPEEVEKSKGDKEEAAEEDKDAKAKKAAKDKGKKKEDEKVEKSEDSDDITGDLIVKAFEELTKSNQSTNIRLDSLEKSLAALLEAFQADKLEKSEGEEKKEEDKKEEDKDDKDEQKAPDEPLLAEDVEKSLKVEEAPEGKAVEYVQKSADGVAVPEETPEKEEEVEQPEQEPEFNARDHVSTVVDHYTKNAATLNRGEQNELKFAVQRVKRGTPTDADVNLFKEIVESAKK